MSEDLELAKSSRHGDYYYKIVADTDYANPRTDWDNLATMVCFHRRYELGDLKESKRYSDPEDFVRSLSQLDTDTPYYERLFNKMDYREINQYCMDHAEKHNIILPLYLYDHSGITMSTSSFYDRWDSGQVGWIYVSHEAIKKEWGWKSLTKKRIAKITASLEAEVKTYDHFLTGNVWGYKVFSPVPDSFDPDQEDIEDVADQIDSCWGFFGDTKESGILDDVNASIAADIAERDKAVTEQLHSHFELLKSWIRNKVALIYRTPSFAQTI
jgi:hypothetical protein